jgi:hypothetical protein
MKITISGDRVTGKRDARGSVRWNDAQLRVGVCKEVATTGAHVLIDDVIERVAR